MSSKSTSSETLTAMRVSVVITNLRADLVSETLWFPEITPVPRSSHTDVDSRYAVDHDRVIRAAKRIAKLRHETIKSNLDGIDWMTEEKELGSEIVGLIKDVNPQRVYTYKRVVDPASESETEYSRKGWTDMRATEKYRQITEAHRESVGM
jgi:hypothetical protein